MDNWLLQNASFKSLHDFEWNMEFKAQQQLLIICEIGLLNLLVTIASHHVKYEHNFFTSTS